ncbi:MAG TPA: hypothetical protein ENK57_12315 [Polyangiaceae bacterium]|nr:hypothetical protein [Polyangiaceae bacterium]
MLHASDRVDFYFRQRETEAELELACELLKQADRDLAADSGIYGVVTGAVQPLTSGHGGFGFSVRDVTRRIFFDHLDPLRPRRLRRHRRRPTPIS